MIKNKLISRVLRTILVFLILGVILSGLPSGHNLEVIYADTSLNIPMFNQLSYSQRLGTCTGCTIASDGCAVTSLAMVLKYFGISVTVSAGYSSTGQQRSGMDPSILDDWLYWQDGYAYNSQGCTGYCLVKWTVLPEGVTASARQYNTSTTRS